MIIYHLKKSCEKTENTTWGNFSTFMSHYICRMCNLLFALCVFILNLQLNPPNAPQINQQLSLYGQGAKMSPPYWSFFDQCLESTLWPYNKKKCYQSSVAASLRQLRGLTGLTLLDSTDLYKPSSFWCNSSNIPTHCSEGLDVEVEGGSISSTSAFPSLLLLVRHCVFCVHGGRRSETVIGAQQCRGRPGMGGSRAGLGALWTGRLLPGR